MYSLSKQSFRFARPWSENMTISHERWPSSNQFCQFYDNCTWSSQLASACLFNKIVIYVYIIINKANFCSKLAVKPCLDLEGDWRFALNHYLQALLLYVCMPVKSFIILENGKSAAYSMYPTLRNGVCSTDLRPILLQTA